MIWPDKPNVLSPAECEKLLRRVQDGHSLTRGQGEQLFATFIAVREMLQSDPDAQLNELVKGFYEAHGEIRSILQNQINPVMAAKATKDQADVKKQEQEEKERSEWLGWLRQIGRALLQNPAFLAAMTALVSSLATMMGLQGCQDITPVAQQIVNTIDKAPAPGAEHVPAE